MGHNAQILDQFTRQAEGFARANATRNEDVLERMLRLSRCGPDDVTLDVACGPGVVVCAFARTVSHATGIDLTPAMLDQARQAQSAGSLGNVSWDMGDVTSLPYEDARFDVVTCRYAFHHFENPLMVLREMARVCRPGGRVVVADCCPEASRAAAYDRVERLRDPSHTHALPPGEMTTLFAAAGLHDVEVESMRLPEDLDSLLGHSFPRKEDVPKLHAMFDEAAENDFLDFTPVRRDGKMHISFPISIFVAEKSA